MVLTCVCDCNNALSCGKVLVVLEADRPDGADRADGLSVDRGSGRLGAVLEHRNAVSVGHR